MTEDFLKKGIGTKEPKSLEPKNVTVLGVRLVPKKKKGSEEIVGELITLICKHPDKEESVELSSVKQLVNEKVKMVALCRNEDEDGLLAKNSAAAKLLVHYKAESFDALIGKDLETIYQSEDIKYLCIKAY